MKIGELAQLTGFTTDTIRWYEKIGLIELDKSDRYENNYRNYKEETVLRLQQIKTIKGFGFTLNEIKDFLLLEKHKVLNCKTASELYNKRLADIERKIITLTQVRDKLLSLKNQCSGNCVDQLRISPM